MTDDAVVERVARAIAYGDLSGEWLPKTADQFVNENWRDWTAQAEAALQSSGWHEMREALGELVAAVENGEAVSGAEAMGKARAALKAANGEPTRALPFSPSALLRPAR